ncbi:S8 family serine peptidase [Phormidesmis priestleyi]|nr:S8 family serine peptidase [Phormidesmis priestleyi]
MNRFDGSTCTALTDRSNFTHSAALTSIATQTNGLQDPFNFSPRTSSSLIALDDRSIDTISDTNRLTSTDIMQTTTDFFGLDQFAWNYQDELTGLATGTFNQPATPGLFATRDAIDSTIAQTTQPKIQLVGGTLGADTFTVLSGIQYNVFSGNGNVEFGRGGRDVIDLSGVLSSSVDFNLATATRGGILFNPGNGTRVFDTLNFSNGSQILFEGIDQISFADTTLSLSVTPNDPGFSQQWNLHMMGVQNAWRFTTGSTNVMIGIEDTGLGMTAAGNIHSDLRSDNTLLYGDNSKDDFFRNVPGEQRIQSTSHGTEVQGVIAAASNNGIGISGINWNSTVANLDVLDNNPGDLSLAQATKVLIDYANSQGQRLVINMSLGGGDIEPDFEQLVAQNQSNALFVIAAGNDGQYGISNPASLASRYANVIAVGASWGTEDKNGIPKAPGSRISYPGWWGSNYGVGLTLMGPSEVLSTRAIDSTYDVSFDFDSEFNGTSAATPNVAGVASLVWSANPYLSANQVQSILSQTAYDLGATGRDLVYGNGFVNADTAVRRALAIAAGAA